MFETKHYEWVAYSTIGPDAKRIFKCNLLQKYSYTIKLKLPLDKHYNCKKIIKYKEETFDPNNKYIIIKYDVDNGSYFDVIHN